MTTRREVMQSLLLGSAAAAAVSPDTAASATAANLATWHRESTQGAFARSGQLATAGVCTAQSVGLMHRYGLERNARKPEGAGRRLRLRLKTITTS